MVGASRWELNWDCLQFLVNEVRLKTRWGEADGGMKGIEEFVQGRLR
jgi:hypothetical protein